MTGSGIRLSCYHSALRTSSLVTGRIENGEGGWTKTPPISLCRDGDGLVMKVRNVGQWNSDSCAREEIRSRCLLLPDG